MARKIDIPTWEKINLTLNEAAAYSNIGVNRLSSLIRDPNCRFVLHVGTKNLIKRREFEQYLRTISDL